LGNVLGQLVKIMAAGHDADQIGFLGQIDDTAVVELFFAGGDILPFAKLVGDNQVFG